MYHEIQGWVKLPSSWLQQEPRLNYGLLFGYELSKSPGWLLTSNMHAESSSVFIDLHLNAEFLFSYICLRSGGSQSRAEF